MTEKAPPQQSIQDVVGRVTARLDASRVLRAYVRQLSAIVDQQEGIARDEAVQAFGEGGDALFRSVREIHYQKAHHELPDMGCVAAIPGMLDLVAPPWWVGIEAEAVVEAVGAADAGSAQEVLPEVAVVVEVQEPDPISEEVPEIEVFPQVDETAQVEGEHLPPAEEAAPAPEEPQATPGSKVFYGIEIEAENVAAAPRVIEDARRAVATGIPEAFFAYDKRVGRHQWRKALYQQVFRDEAGEVGMMIPEHPGETPVKAPSPATAALPDTPPASYEPEPTLDEEDMVFGDLDGDEEAALQAEEPDEGLPAFLQSDDSEGPNPDRGGPRDAFGEPSEQPVEAWLRPFAEEAAPEAAHGSATGDEGRVVPFAAPRAPPRPIKMAPGLGRRPSG